MNAKNTEAPSTKRKFANGWSELDYLCKKVHYWLYARKRKPKAMYYRDRLERVLNELPKTEMAIIREEGLALLCELKGNIRESISHRMKEIRLMERLHKDAQSNRYDDNTREYMLRDRDGNALTERRFILATLGKIKLSFPHKLGA
jgi:hypothetical protein